MSRQEISVTQSFRTPVDTVFSALSDHNRLSTVLGVPVKRIKDGQDDPNGVGSIRRIGPPPLGTQETVTDFLPNERVAYRISKFGGPVRNHRGEVLFAATESGCDVTWNIVFETFPDIVGQGLRTVLKTGVARGLSKLARTL